MTHHTPGPWQHEPATEHHGDYVVTDFGSTVCDLYVMSKPVSWSAEGSKPVAFMHEQAAANARLIAAAPDLLEALQEIAAAHIPDQPAASEGDELAWAQRHVGTLRRIATAALAKALPPNPAEDAA